MSRIMNENAVLPVRYDEEQDMQYEEDSTIDDSGIQPTVYSSPSSDWNTQQRGYPSPVSVSKSQSKTSKKMKSEDGDEDIDIDNFVQQDVQRIPVKTLRKVIPKLRIAVYCADSVTSGKRKLKHLWDERPADWPPNIPFKDPNNACKDVKKPGKDELGPMFNFLKAKYLQNHGNVKAAASTATAVDDYSSYSHQVMTESSTDKGAFFYSSVSNNPILPQITLEQPRSKPDSPWISSKTETTPYVDISELMKQEIPLTFGMIQQQQQEVVSLSQPASATISVNMSSKLQPAIDLYARLEKKYTSVLNLTSDNRHSVSQMLEQVEQAVIKKLFDYISLSDNRASLMFLDAGHQLEALLDVMLVLGKVDEDLLQSGCSEIIKKFSTQNVHFALFDPQFGKRETFRGTSTIISARECDMILGEDNKPEDLISSLGLGLPSSKDSKVIGDNGYVEAPLDSVPLFKPRIGVGGILEESGMDVMGIQTRLVIPSPNPGDSKLPSMMTVKPMYIEEVGLQSNYPQKHDAVEEIMKQLQESEKMMMDEYLNTSNSGLVGLDDRYWSEGITDILEVIEKDQQHMNSGGFQSFCEETGGDLCSQLLPSNTARPMPPSIPVMVEILTCADSEGEDYEIPSPAKSSRYGGGGGGGDYRLY